LIMIRQGLVRPGVLISLDKISSLRQISYKDNEIILGAMVTLGACALIHGRFDPSLEFTWGTRNPPGGFLSRAVRKCS